MIQERADIMDEKRVEQFSDLLTVGKVQSTLEWDPVGELALRIQTIG